MFFAIAPTLKKVVDKSSSAGGTSGAIGRAILRFFQFVMALTVAGLYGVDLHAASKAGVSSDSRWVFAEIVAGVAATTVLIYGLPFVKSYITFFWDIFIALLWVIVLGIFGKLYVNADTSVDHRIVRMKHAVYVDAANLLLWVISAGLSTFIWLKRRRESKGPDGSRAKV